MSQRGSSSIHRKVLLLDLSPSQSAFTPPRDVEGIWRRAERGLRKIAEELKREGAEAVPNPFWAVAVALQLPMFARSEEVMEWTKENKREPLEALFTLHVDAMAESSSQLEERGLPAESLKKWEDLLKERKELVKGMWREAVGVVWETLTEYGEELKKVRDGWKAAGKHVASALHTIAYALALVKEIPSLTSLLKGSETASLARSFGEKLSERGGEAEWVEAAALLSYHHTPLSLDAIKGEAERGLYTILRILNALPQGEVDTIKDYVARVYLDLLEVLSWGVEVAFKGSRVRVKGVEEAVEFYQTFAEVMAHHFYTVMEREGFPPYHVAFPLLKEKLTKVAQEMEELKGINGGSA